MGRCIGAILISLLLACNASGAAKCDEDPGCAGLWLLLFLDRPLGSETAIYLAGTLTFNESGQDFVVRKYSSDGVEDTNGWPVQFDGGTNNLDAAAAAMVDTSGDVYVGGSLFGTDADWALKKFSARGVEDTAAWDKLEVSSSGQDRVRCLAGASDGSVYAGGYRNVAGQGNNWYVKKYSLFGNEDSDWNLVLNGSASALDRVLDCAVMPDDSVIMVGTTTRTGTGQDWAIKRYRSDALDDKTQWARSYDGEGGADRAQGVAVDPETGDVYIVGYLTRSGTGIDWGIKKISVDGVEDTINWNITFDGGSNGDDRAEDVAVGPQGSVYVVGQIDNGDTDWWIKKYSSTGEEDRRNWDKVFDGGAGDGSARRVLVSPDGDVYVSGNLAADDGTNDWWIKKFSSDGVEDENWNLVVSGEVTGDDFLNAMALELERPAF